MALTCSKCDAPAIYFRRYTSEALCKTCLIRTTQRRVRLTINKRKMFRETDRIGVAISGGKDSAVLLQILHDIEADFPRATLHPFTIDEGIQGYRDKALEAARSLVNSLDLSLHVVSFKQLFGHTLDSIVHNRGETRRGACSYCGVLRRHAINEAAKELGVDVVATGHNLDDEAQTVLMNILRGDAMRIVRTNRPRELSVDGFIPRVKPLMELSERDIVAYAHFLDLPFHDIPCPYASDAYRNDVRAFLGQMEYKRPGTLLATLHSGDAIAASLSEQIAPGLQNTCARCGSPTTGRICKVCQILEEIDGR